MNAQNAQNPPIARRSTWLRLLYMVLFAIVFQIVELIVAVIAIVQFASVATTGEPFGELRKLGGRSASYARDIASFLTFETDRIPFPFAPGRERAIARSTS